MTTDRGSLMTAARLRQIFVVFPALALIGCGPAVDPQATPAPDNSALDSLPSDTELQTVLGATVKTAESKSGGDELLRDDADRYATPECARVTHPLLRRTYDDAGLNHVTFGRWDVAPAPGDKTKRSVRVGIVEMDSPDSAETFLVDSAARWADCRGRTVTHYNADTTTYIDDIVDVVESDGVVSAALVVSDDIGVMTPAPHQRALGVVSRYVVDVDVYGPGWPTAQPGDRAAAVVQLTLTNLEKRT